MSETSETFPEAPTTSDASRCRSRKRNNRLNKPSFKGNIDALGDNIYDVNKAKDKFNSTTQAIAEYISSNLKYAGEFLNALDPDDLGFDELPDPTRPTTTDQIDISIYHNDRKEWREKVARRKALMEQSFSIMLGQCSLSIRNRLKSLPSYSGVKTSLDVIELLMLIGVSMYVGSTTQNIIHSGQEALERLNMSLRIYLKNSVSISTLLSIPA